MSFLDRLFGKHRLQPAATPAPLDAGAFAQRYAATVRSAHPGARVTVEPGADAASTLVRWTTPTGFEAAQFMGNLYTRYCADPSALQALLAEHLRVAEEVGAAPDDGPVLLLPVIKTLDWQAASQAQRERAGLTGAATGPLTRPLADRLLVAYVEDRPRAMNYVMAGQLPNLGLDATGLHARALHDLATLLPQLRVEGGGGRYAARLDRNYDASMALLFEHWRSRLELRGEPVFAIAARDELLICGSEDAEAVASLGDMATRIVAASAYALTDQLFVWQQGSFTPWP